MTRLESFVIRSIKESARTQPETSLKSRIKPTESCDTPKKGKDQVEKRADKVSEGAKKNADGDLKAPKRSARAQRH